jgi:hypothetical protein
MSMTSQRTEKCCNKKYVYTVLYFNCIFLVRLKVNSKLLCEEYEHIYFRNSLEVPYVFINKLIKIYFKKYCNSYLIVTPYLKEHEASCETTI